MNQVLAIAAASIREHSRRRLIVFFVGASVLISAGLGYLTVVRLEGNPLSIPANLGANQFMGFLALIAAIAVSMGNIGRPFSDGEASLVLARPVARWQYAAGRLAASAAIIGGLCALIALELQIVRLVDQTAMSPALWGHWGTQWFNLTLVASIATLLSSVITNPVIVAVSTYFIDSFSRTVGTFYRAAEAAQVSGGAGGLIRFLWYITPKRLGSSFFFSEFGDAGDKARRALDSVFGNSPGLIAWAVAYLVAVVTLTLYVVGRKEA